MSHISNIATIIGVYGGGTTYSGSPKNTSLVGSLSACRIKVFEHKRASTQQLLRNRFSQPP